MEATLTFTKLVVDDVDAMADYYCSVFGLHRGKRERFEKGLAGEPIDEVSLTPDPGEPFGSLTLLRYESRSAPPNDEVILGFNHRRSRRAARARAKRGRRAVQRSQGDAGSWHPRGAGARSGRSPERARGSADVTERKRARRRNPDRDSEAPEPRRRGRPPRLSRELVVDAVLGMLEREPDEPVTLARIAREVDAVPAALYRHFEGLDDLLDSVLTRVLEDIELGLDERAPWEDQPRELDGFASLASPAVTPPRSR